MNALARSRCVGKSQKTRPDPIPVLTRGLEEFLPRRHLIEMSLKPLLREIESGDDTDFLVKNPS
jgi:hypothetical protein